LAGRYASKETATKEKEENLVQNFAILKIIPIFAGALWQ
jgi:hypothetical protein